MKMAIHGYVIVTLLFICFTAWGVFDIRANYFLTSVIKNNRVNDKSVALTFDDGPTLVTLEVLDLLKKHNTRATFFCIGRQNNILKFSVRFCRMGMRSAIIPTRMIAK